ncbi:MAG: two-component system cell cycle response regulator [Glaciecola sp.]|jgi:two-component system cell cycle response regulator
MKVIVAEDDRVTALLIEQQLKSWDYTVLLATNGQEALHLIKSNPDTCLFLLDWQMPEIDGIELCKLMKTNRLVESCYVIILTGKSAPDSVVIALDSGADDFITKPFVPEELRARLKVGQRVVDSEAKLMHQATHDPLTDVLNHRAINSELSNLWERSRRDNSELAVMMLDIDHFKKINDTYGHQAGDFALKQFCKMVASQIRPYDAFGRYGGEEFVLCLPSADPDQAMKIAERIRVRVNTTPLTYDGLSFSITVSIGVAMFSENYSSHDGLLMSADKAAYQAKSNGRNCVVYAES